MTRIVALYKTFSGPELVEASLASIYPHVSGIVLIHSDTGWDGKTGNTVRAVAESWAKAHDTEGKVRNVTADVSAQGDQYEFGLKVVREHFAADFLLLIDSDEVWDYSHLAEAKRRLAMDEVSVRFTCRMRTYVKSCFFRVEPPEFCHPTVFLRNVPGLKFIGPRASKVSPTVHWPDVFFHHFTYVRDCEEDVFAKVVTSTIGDGCRTLDLSTWKREKWDRLPNALDLHTTVGAARSWSRVSEVSPNDLPDDVRDNPLVLRHRAERLAELDTVARGLPPMSIIIPSCRASGEVVSLVAEIERRSTGEFEVIATCKSVSASANRNDGLNRAAHDLVVMVDDDIRDLPYGWNQRLAAGLYAEPRAVMVSARLMRPDGRVGILMGAAPFTLGARSVATEGKLATACVAFHRTSLRFDEKFIGSGYEDDDFAYQLRRANSGAVFIVDNTIMVTHLNEMKNQRGEYHAHNKAYFSAKWSER